MLRRAIASAAALCAAFAMLLAGATTAEAAGTTVTLAAASSETSTGITPHTTATVTARTVFREGMLVQPGNVAANAAWGLTGSQKSAAAYLAAVPTAIWLGDWFQGQALVDELRRDLAAAEATHTTPVFVTYALPDRDCGNYSAGGLSPAQYRTWAATIAGTLKGHRAVVLVEPDSLSTACAATHQRLWAPLLRAEAKALRAAAIPTYLDGGLSGQALSVSLMKRRLTAAGIRYARGFFTNVSNYRTLANERRWASSLSRALHGKKYVIDTSRDGKGYHGTWCNDLRAGLGKKPRVIGHGALDAILWIKTPGASDGTCNGGPNAGAWYPQFAVNLVRNRLR